MSHTSVLRSRYCPGQQGPAAAWFITGREGAEWLREIARWQVPTSAMRLYILPCSRQDLSPYGALVVWPGAADVEVQPRATPFTLQGGRLYLPREMRLEPPVTQEELRALLVWDVAVMHPAIGLVGFSSGDGLSVADLIEPPLRLESLWNRAVAAPAPPRLTVVKLLEPPSVESVLELGGEDIGDQPADDVPAPDDEPSNAPTARLGRMVTRVIASGARALGRAGTKLGVGGKAASRLEKWGEERVQQIAAASEYLRQRELNRLLHLLEKDPDQGLRYALPLTAQDTGRGVAPPSNRLMSRLIDFRLGGLGGGEPTDHWALEPNQQWTLQQRYRDLASREMRLRRYRRAAYIFAHLLGDFAAAASALKQGGHFHEAAVVYRKKLNQPQEAAACLEEGGLLLEALDLYRELGLNLKVGDIYGRLEQHDDAMAAYRSEVELRHKRGDPLGAAEVLYRKMSLEDEALDMLAATWPHGPHAKACLTARLELLCKLTRHEQLQHLLGQLRREPVPAGMSSHLITALAAATKLNIPPDIRHQATDLVRVVVGRRLAGAGAAEAGKLLQVVRDMTPGDRLLDRDTRRFMQKRSRSTVGLPPIRPGSGVTLTAQLALPRWCRWDTFAGDGRYIWAAGPHRDGGLSIIRSSLQGSWDTLQFDAPGNIAGMTRLLLMPRMLLATVIGSPNPLAVQTIATSEAHVLPTTVGGLASITHPVAGWCAGGKITIWTISAQASGFQVARHYTNGRLIGQRYFPGEWLDVNGTSWFPMIASQHGVMIGDSRGVLFVPNGGDCKLMQMPSVTSLHTPPAGGAPCVIAMTEAAAMLLRLDRDEETVTQFARADASTRVGFTAEGHLVLVSNTGEGQVYRLGDGARKLAEFACPNVVCVAVLLGSAPGEFILAGADGTMRVMTYHG